MGKLYFTHPFNTYGTPLEAAVERLIADTILNGQRGLIENPNQPHHQEGYKQYAQRQKESDTRHKGMNYFFDEVLPKCFGCAALPYLDNRFGLGVAGEAKWYVERGLAVWFVEFQRRCGHTLSHFIENPQCGLFRVRLTTVEENGLLLSDDPKLVIPHIETRLRTWKVYDKEHRSYEEAHRAPTEPYPGFYSD